LVVDPLRIVSIVPSSVSNVITGFESETQDYCVPTCG